MNEENTTQKDLEEFEELKSKLIDIALNADDLLKSYILGSLCSMVDYLKNEIES